MPLERLPESGPEYRALKCYAEEHRPPNAMYLLPGKYRYTCPKCGHSTEFRVLSIEGGDNSAEDVED